MAKLSKDLKDVQTILEKIKSLEEDLSKNVDTATAKTKKYKDAVKKTEDELKKLNGQLKESLELTNDLGQNVDEVGEGFHHLGAMAKASPKNLRSAAAGAASWAEKMQVVHEAAKKSHVQLGLMAKAVGSLGGAVGGISKLLLGWPGLVLMGLKALVDASVKYDNWIKGLNKNFAMVRGPDIFTSDVAKQMKQFNSAIFNIGENMRAGWDSKDVMAFTDALVQSGTALSKITNNMTDFRKASFIAAKADANFGMDIQVTGSLMSTMINDMRMNLNEVDDAFTQVTFDAQKSGLSTDKFWNSVQNATSSLAMYGKFVKGVGKAIGETQKTQVTGAKESSDFVERMTQKFAGGWKDNLKLLAMMQRGGYKFGEVFKKAGIEAQNSLKGLEGEKVVVEAKYEEAKKTGDEDAQKKLQARLSELTTQIGNTKNRLEAVNKYQKLGIRADKGDQSVLADLATGLGYVSGDAIPMLVASLKGMGSELGNISEMGFGDKAFKTLLEAANSMGLTEQDTKQMVEMMKSLRATTEIALGVDKESAGYSKSFAGRLRLLQKNGFKDPGVVKILKGISSDGSYTADKADADTKSLQEMLGVSEETAKEMVRSAMASEDVKNLMISNVNAAEDSKKDLGDIEGNIKGLLRSNNYGYKRLQSNFNFQEKSTKATQTAYDDTFDQIRDNTLTFEKMKTIAKDGIYWQVGSWKALTSIDSWVTKIGRHYLSGSKEVKEAKKYLKEQKIDMTIPEKTFADYQRSQEEAVKSGDLEGAAKSAQIMEMIKTATESFDESKVAQYDKSSKYEELLKKKESLSRTATDDAKEELTNINKQISQYESEALKQVDLSKLQFLKQPAPTTPTKQGMQKPEMVTHAGAVMLHPNETILPASYGNFQTKPMLMNAAATPGGTVGKGDINIQINASDYVMANKMKKGIENVVRSIMYEEQLR